MPAPAAPRHAPAPGPRGRPPRATPRFETSSRETSSWILRALALSKYPAAAEFLRLQSPVRCPPSEPFPNSLAPPHDTTPDTFPAPTNPPALADPLLLPPIPALPAPGMLSQPRMAAPPSRAQ